MRVKIIIVAVVAVVAGVIVNRINKKINSEVYCEEDTAGDGEAESAK